MAFARDAHHGAGNQRTLLDKGSPSDESLARVSTPDQHDFYDPDPVSEFGSLQRLQSHIAQMAPHQQERNSGRLLIWAERRLRELSEANQMAAEHMERDREYAARLEAELDALKANPTPNEHHPSKELREAAKIIHRLEDHIQMRCERDRFQSYVDLEAERNRLLDTVLQIAKLAQAVMPEGKQ